MSTSFSKPQQKIYQSDRTTFQKLQSKIAIIDENAMTRTKEDERRNWPSFQPFKSFSDCLFEYKKGWNTQIGVTMMIFGVEYDIDWRYVLIFCMGLFTLISIDFLYRIMVGVSVLQFPFLLTE